MKLNISILIFIVFTITCISCKDYLDVIPDNIPTVDHAFNNRQEAEKFLFGCYSFLPSHASVYSNPAFTAGDEVWILKDIYQIGEIYPWGIAKGEQGTQSPIANYWSSNQTGGSLYGGKRLFIGLRDCNIFLENIDRPFDLEDLEKKQWIAEVKFIKAYLHFWLFRMYGPIPLIKENMPISSSSKEVRVYREPIDQVVDYIVSLLDEVTSEEQLPLQITDLTNDMGRITRPMAYALKAQVLVYAASPLFNGNSDYADMVDNRNINLFPQEYKQEKWEKAAVALKEAIDICHQAGHELYDFNTSAYSHNLNEKTIKAMQTRGAVTEPWNKEIIWGDPNSNPGILQRLCFPPFNIKHYGDNIAQSFAPPIRVVEQFYSKNGVPIEEDIEWQEIDWYGLRNGDEEHKYYIDSNVETINLHFNREARFYGAISFDGGTFYGNGQFANDEKLNVTHFKIGGGGYANIVLDRHSTTGYLVKKLINVLTSVPENTPTLTTYRYAFPVIRLADLYLMYAEALNEVKEMPDPEIYEFIDMVRERTGLEGVVESWQNYSINPQKPLNKEGMREIIYRERLNELAFEGSRFWDLRRWKLAEQYLNQPIKGLNIWESETEEFYKTQNVYSLTFSKKDYFWPIKQAELTRNSNLLQNYGW
jgi:starch-binding outer membrane protein, SusD/RagB family